MSLINFDSNLNKLTIIKGSVQSLSEIINKSESNTPYFILKENNEFKGVEINDYLMTPEWKGVKAENLFKKLLDDNKIPYLYIGQSPVGIDRSTILKKELNSIRPDYLVNFPDMGNLFIDIKCRKKKGFPNSSKSYFQLFKDEINLLINTFDLLRIPIWIVFVDESSLFNETSDKTEYNLIPVSLLKKYLHSLKKHLSNREYSMLTCVRIPDELLHQVENKLLLNIGITDPDETLVIKIVECYKGLNRIIEDKVRESIRKTPVLKTNLAQTLYNETSKFAFKAEVESIIDILIKEKVIKYKAYEPLSLQGE